MDSDQQPSTVDVLDRRDGRVYVMPEGIALAVDVALPTGRPLLLRGEPGSGKSSLAAFIAKTRNWRYYEHVVTSRTQARDLLWTFDSVRRLGDAQVRSRSGETSLEDHDYVAPGVFWWAFSPDSARSRGATELWTPAVEPNADANAGRSPDHAVVLIDEVDKAEPDMPNGLLVPLGSSEFVVTEINYKVTKAPAIGPVDPRMSRHLVIITTNEERELPQAFLRRCVVAWLEQPHGQQLVEIAKAHLSAYGGEPSEGDLKLVTQLVEAHAESCESARRLGLRPPSTAEFLDALRACRTIGITVDSEQWAELRSLTLVKPQNPLE